MPNGQVTLTWGDGDHVFNIAKIGQALELEDKCGCGIAEVFDRLRSGKWCVNDFRETLRLGLIGGGMEPVKALILIKRYVDDRPFQESVEPALVIMMAAIVGVPGDDVGKKEEAERAAARETSSLEPMADSSAPQSTAPVPLSDGTLEQPTP